ncbi:Kinesin motor domain containing protein [Tritrichomonas foetus]|uniref:Kinesin-like protein n=1 Tax=Tritrichomonas foetus TaxID=1144522 RepID=A0A1J4KDW9_9EUKA|nr:Kinesin motor domain containing protein [Tritrichomonas foetus]|eukprot:OHT09104.1 Kinesin motor domain containing protein [Tritrichomonas foetus]
MPPKSAEREAVKVAVRLRPMSANEKKEGFHKIVDIDQSEATVYVTNPQGQKVNFKFDFAFPEGIPQEEVYDTTAAPIVSGVLEGFNGTIFAYGQTGTGKTFSMDGKEGDLRGIMPRAFEHIFEYINANSDTQQFMVTVTYVEIYNNELRDLLSKDQKEQLKIREDPQHGVQIRGVAVHKVQCLDDLSTLLNFGKKNRKVRKTNMNAESSRSHSILTLNVETLTQMEGGQHVRSARLNLVDLAGSERVAKTGAEGEGMKEGININYELMILGNCIAALTSKEVTHVPYRDSKLTMLLRDSLGGNARTMMIAALGPASYNFMETMSTLRYAERAKKIENKPKVNMDPKDALLLKYQEELAALQAQLNGTGGGGPGGGPVKSDEERIKDMEDQLAKQRQQLENASNMAKTERLKLEQELKAQASALDEEKARRAKYEERLQELKKFAVIGDLKKKTEQNEAQIKEFREKLRQREAKAKALAAEVEERQKRREAVITKCDDMEAQVQQISDGFKSHVEQYQNLKLKLPEVQKQIQADREEMASNIDYLNKQIELYQLIIDNFIPESEVESIRKNFVYNKEKNVWEKAELDKKALVSRVMSLERPKSAVGGRHPTVVKEEIPAMGNIQLSPMPVKSRIKPGPMKTQARCIEDSITQAFKDDGMDFVLDVPKMTVTVISGGQSNRANTAQNYV